MKILFDQGTPVPLRGSLLGHTVITAYEKGWQTLSNGNLLSAAEDDGFEVLLTTDQNLQYQQNLNSRKIAIIVLTTTSWPKIQNNIRAIQKALENIPSGSFIEIKIQ